MKFPYTLTWNCSVLSRMVLLALADAAFAPVSSGQKLPLKGQYIIEAYNSPNGLLHAYLRPDDRLIRIFIPRSYAVAVQENELQPRQYPGLSSGPKYFLNDLEECCLYLLAHEFRHCWPGDSELVCELAAEAALVEFRALRNYWLPSAAKHTPSATALK